MASQSEAKVTAFKIPIIDGGEPGFNILILSRVGNSLVMKYKMNFNAGRWCSEATQMANSLDNFVNNDDIVIIVTNGSYAPFELINQNSNFSRRILKSLRRVGMRSKSFDARSNYILISSPKGDIYYESVSNDTAFYPYITLNKMDCRIKPMNLYPLKNKSYTFADTLVGNNESKYRCALEASLYGLDKFAISGENVCLLVDDKMYNYIEKDKRLSDQCYMGTGSFTSASIYNFGRLRDLNEIYKNGVIINNLENFKGHNTVLNEGTYNYTYGGGHNVLRAVRSMAVPKGFIVHLLTHNGVLVSYIGPKIFPIMNNLTFVHKADVQRIRENSVIFCENDIGNGVCYTFGPGNYRLPSYLFFNIKTIYIPPSTRRIELFKDLNYFEPVQRFQIPFTSYRLEVEFPRIVRSIKIL